MPLVAIVFPPLRVSRDFIDYPYFADLGAVQAAAVVRAAGHEASLAAALALRAASREPREKGYVRLGATADDTIDRIPKDADAIVVGYTPFHQPPARDPLLASVIEPLRL